MDVRDVIINQEKYVKTIYDPEHAKTLQDDKNCQLLLNFLLEGPMTFEDIKEAFKQVQAEKSDKTIYGYLNKLKKADLVMETGKRIITYSENQIKTLTLYSRTAKVFYIAIDTEKKARDNYFKLTGKLLCQILGFDSLDEDYFKELYDRYIELKRKDITKINEQADDEIVQMLAETDVRGTKFVIDTLMMFAFIGQNEDIYKELMKCLKK